MVWPLVAQGARALAPKVVGSIAASKIGGEVMDHFKGDDEKENAQTMPQQQQGFGAIPTAQNMNVAQPGNNVIQQGAKDGFGESKSRFKGLTEALGAGALSGGAAAMHSYKENHDIKDALRAGAFGAAAGSLGKMSYDHIQEEGGGLQAGLTGAAASAFASKIEPGGPGVMKSMATGFGSAAMGDFLHDKATEAGHEGFGDLAGGATFGGGLGYALEGDKKSMGLGAALGGGAGLVDTLADKGLGDLHIDDAGPQANNVATQEPVSFGGGEAEADTPEKDAGLDFA